MDILEHLTRYFNRGRQHLGVRLPQNTVTLRGEVRDPDGHIKEITWEQIGGSSQSRILSPKQCTTEVTNLKFGQYTFRLKATDDNGESATDETVVKIDATPGPSEPKISLDHPPPYRIHDFGVWPLLNGDRDMNTNDHDIVKPRCITTLKVNENSIDLIVEFLVKETVGDHTTYGGEITHHDIYTAPSNKKIIGIKVNGNDLSQTLYGNSRGKNWDLTDFLKTNGTYWNYLQFRIDSGSENDFAAIGVKGQLQIEEVRLIPRD